MTIHPEQVLQFNEESTTSPTPLDDINAGYQKGSKWLDTSTNKVWMLVDDSPGVAIWLEITYSATTDFDTILVSDNTGHVLTSDNTGNVLVTG